MISDTAKPTKERRATIEENLKIYQTIMRKTRMQKLLD